MDYLTIVLNGYFTNKKHLHEYFFREFLKAKDLHYTPDEYFNGCNIVIQNLKWDIKKEFLAEKNELQENLKYAKSINDQENEAFFYERLNDISKISDCYCSVNLNIFSKGRFLGDLDCSEINYIEKNIIQAFERIKEEEKQTFTNPMDVTQTSFDLFIEEIFNLIIKVVEVDNSKLLSLNYYNQFEGDFEYKLKDLSKKACFEVAKLNIEQQTNYLAILKKGETKFDDFWNWYNNVFINNQFSPSSIDFKHEIRNFFNVPNFDESRIFNAQFIENLHDAAMFKHGELSGLIKDIENLISLQNQTGTFSFPQPLKTNLTTVKRANLFDELVKGGFISNDPDCFYWAIGATDETEPKQPGQWQPIEWKKALQLLRELLEAIKSDGISKAEMKRITPSLFSKGEKSIELPKNKVVETQFHKRLKKIIATILNN